MVDLDTTLEQQLLDVAIRQALAVLTREVGDAAGGW
jgi:hypothetical protein